MSSISSILQKAKITKHKRGGNLYRSNTQPIIRPKVFDKDFNARKLLNQNFKVLPKAPPLYEYVKLSNDEPIPIAELEHGLEKTLFSPGVHRIRDPFSNKLNFPSYLEKLHHPDSIDYTKMPPFKTPSADNVHIYYKVLKYFLSFLPNLETTFYCIRKNSSL